MATPEQAFAAYSARGLRVSGRIEWFDRQVAAGLRLTMEKRLDITAQLLRDKIVANISLPVEKSTGSRGRGGRKKARVTRRSQPGEFPRAETTRLMKDIFWDRRGPMVRIVGTSLDYGLWLEVALDRSFLRRTLDNERSALARLLTRTIN